MTKKRIAGVSFALTLSLLGLSGCSQAALPSPHAAKYGDHPAISISKLEEIDAAIVQTTADADSSLDTDKLRTRFVGPAATDRAFAYQKKNLLGEAMTLDKLSTTVIQSAIGQDNGYPRVAIEVMEAPEGGNVKSLHVLKQMNARSNWSLWSSMKILPKTGVSPSISTGETGAEIIGADEDKGIAASPNSVLDAYIHVNNTRENPEGFTFADDIFRSSTARQKDNFSSALEGVGEAKIEFARGDEEPFALRTEDGGALVVSDFKYALTIHVTDSRRPVTIPSNQDVSLAATGEANKSLKITDTMVAHFSGAAAFYVPPAKAKDQTIHVIAVEYGTPVKVENS